MSATGTLVGVRVIDMTQHIAGPYCSLLLADAGAEVIRLEPPGGADDRKFGYMTRNNKDAYSYVVRNRGKKAITLNLRTPEGVKILHELVALSDVLLESYAVRDKKRFGLEYGALSAYNPRIIVASISAFGKTGPYVNKIGFDPNAQAMSGAMACTGFPDGAPVRTAPAWCDYSAALHTAYGIMLALLRRAVTNRGQEIDVSLLDSAASLMAQHGIYAEYSALGVERQRMGNASPYAYADSFQAKDGVVFISATRNGVWKRLAAAVGREDFLTDPRYKTDWERAKNRESISEIVRPWVASRTCEVVLKLLEEAQVPCSKVQSIAEATNDAHLRVRGMHLEKDYPGAGKVLVSGTVIKLSDMPAGNPARAPLVGEHNGEVYGKLLGRSPQQIEDLTKAGII